jgi:HicA toxin of bacterial toxin-antitoxin,
MELSAWSIRIIYDTLLQVLIQSRENHKTGSTTGNICKFGKPKYHRRENPISNMAYDLPENPADQSNARSHHKFKHPDRTGYVTVIHPNHDFAIGTLRSIFKQAGWEWR